MTSDLVMQLINIDKYEEEDKNNLFCVRLYGTLENHEKVVVNVKGFKPYFYVLLPEDSQKFNNEVELLLKLKGIMKDKKIIATLENKHIFKEFNNYKLFKFVKLEFENTMCFYWARKVIINNFDLKCYETKIDPLLRFIHDTNITTCGWIKISEYIKLNNTMVYDGLYYECHYSDIEPYKSTDMSPLIVASFDIECDSLTGGFPDPKQDPIIQIGTTFHKLGEENIYYTHMVTLGSCSPIDGVDLESYNNEKDVLLSWMRMIQRMNPDVITGFNINLFDFWYIRQRTLELGCDKEFTKLGRCCFQNAKYEHKETETKAYGVDINKYYDMPGRIIVDLIKIIKKESKLESYKLDSVAAEYIRDRVGTDDIINESLKSTTTDIIISSNQNELTLKSTKYAVVGKKVQIMDNIYTITKIYENIISIDSHIYNISNNEKITFINIEEYDNKTKIYVVNKFITTDRKIMFGENATCYNILECNDDFIVIDAIIPELRNNNGVKYSLMDYEINYELKQTTIYTPTTFGINKNRFVKFVINEGVLDTGINDNEKYKVVNVMNNSFTINEIITNELLDSKKHRIFWTAAKDDVTPNDIFRLQKGSADDRRTIAEYCIQDCILCNKLMIRLLVLTNLMGMANVCLVPLPFILFRGQSIKILSLLLKECKFQNHILPDNELTDEEKKSAETYEGATVFDPYIGAYYDPITVLDYNSLYPNSMIYKNISHECLVKDKKYLGLEDYDYYSSKYKYGDEWKTSIYAKSKTGKIGILAKILIDLLNKRKETNKLKEQEKDPFKKKVFDGLQLAFKVTANSLYGQCGTKSSTLYNVDIASSTTSTGRECLNVARVFAEVFLVILVNAIFTDYDMYVQKINLLFDKKIDEYLGEKYIKQLKKVLPGEELSRYEYLTMFKTNKDDIDKKFIKFGDEVISTREKFIKLFHNKIFETLKDYTIDPLVIYGDTDSIFVNFKIRDKLTNTLQRNKTGLQISIILGQLCSEVLHKILQSPENLAYEKTMWPLFLLKKKKYFGYLYESNVYKYYLKFMGIELKRRDNAPIVKIIMSGVINVLLNNSNVKAAMDYIEKVLCDVLDNKFNIDKFITSKNLKKNYKAKRESLVHVGLADRVAKRDPNNAFQINDRVPFVYIVTASKATKQSFRVETPEYIKANNLRIDYLFYITNQIMKPILKILKKVTENPEYIFDKYIAREKYAQTLHRNKLNNIVSITQHFNVIKKDVIKNDIVAETNVYKEDNVIKNDVVAEANVYKEDNVIPIVANKKYVMRKIETYFDDNESTEIERIDKKEVIDEQKKEVKKVRNTRKKKETNTIDKFLEEDSKKIRKSRKININTNDNVKSKFDEDGNYVDC